MISLQDGIKYLAIAAIIYFLIKAFTHDKLNDKLNDTYILLLVLIIMAIVIFIMNQKGCPSRNNSREGFQVTNPPIVPSIYAGPFTSPNTGTIADPNQNQESAQILPWKNVVYENDDVRDFANIMRINKEILHDLIENEQKVGNKIRSNYRDDMVFTSTHPFNTVPLGTQLYGYTYLPPENWFRAYERPPVCISDRNCPVCPMADSGTADLLHFDTTNNNRGTEGIDLRYIKKVLNQNR